MIVGIPKETYPDERRVSLVPGLVPTLTKAGLTVVLEPGAGVAAGHADAAYTAKGALLASSRDELFARADVVLQVRAFGANLDAGREDLQRLRAGQAVIGLFEPLTSIRAVDEAARTGAAVFALELLPRITRAQSMDVLSSMATIAGYKAVLLAAESHPRLFPMLTTAAGTVVPARVFVIGAGVAGLMAIATARRLGAIVEAYDVRVAVREQVQSLGAKFVELPAVPATSEDAGGYAKAQDEEFYRRQRELMTKVVAQSDVVITTAAVPGTKAPLLLAASMVAAMQPGSLIVDLAAERGGNCELTRPGETVVVNDVKILGPLNLASTVPTTASQLYAKNVVTFLLHVLKDGKLRLDPDDEIIRETLVCQGGQVRHPKIQQALGTATVGTGSPREE